VTAPDVAPGDPLEGTTDSTEPPADQPPAPAPLDPSPHVRVLLATFALFDARDAAALAALGLGDAQGKADEAQAAVDRGEQQLADARASLEAAKRDLSEFSVGLFIHADGGMSTGTEIDQFGVFELRKTKELTDSVLDHKVQMVSDAKDRIAQAEATLDQLQQGLAAAQDVVAQNQASVDQTNQGLNDAQQELRTAQRADVLVPFQRDPDDEGELDDPQKERSADARLADTATGQHQWELTIMGPSVLTPEEMAAWFAQRQVTPTRARASADNLARFFIDEGDAEGIRGDVAFAQAILETGSFTNDDTVNYNNFAGIGHCDSCPSGWNFSTPQDGVRAQIQLLKSYVFEKPEYANDLVDRRLHGPAGCCQTWNELSGVWASGGGYGALIMSIYQDMLEWVYQQRTGSPPPPRPDPSG
jgi:hypothetical protein